MDLNLEAAAAELDVKTLAQIQAETAHVWGARALVAYRRYGQTSQRRWLLDADEYGHEALEHAALAGPEIYRDLYHHLEGPRRELGLL